MFIPYMKPIKKVFCLHALLILAATAIVCAGCGKSTKSAATADKFGTNKLETVFADAGMPIKSVVQKAKASIGAQDYGAAYDALQGLTRNPSLTSEQMEALKSSLLALGDVPRRAP